MKKLLIAASLVALLGFVVSGCAVMPYAPGFGYSSYQGPIVSTGKATGTKVGTATCVNYVGVYMAGDCSIEAAAKAGEITKVNTVDFDFINYGPFYMKTTTTVTGE